MPSSSRTDRLSELPAGAFLALRRTASTTHRLLLLVALAIGLCVLAAPARAVTRTDGESVKASDKRCDDAYYDKALQKWRCPSGDEAGRGWMRKYTGSGYPSVAIATADLPAKALFKGIPVKVSQFDEIVVEVSWAVSDSDSCAIEVFAIGKISASTADGYDFVFDSNPAGAGLNGWLCGPHDLQTTARYWDGVALLVPSTTSNLIPSAAGVTTNQVSFVLADNLGRVPHFDYLQIFVANRTNTQIDDVSVTLFARGD